MVWLTHGAVCSGEKRSVMGGGGFTMPYPIPDDIPGVLVNGDLFVEALVNEY
jgi:hypothetical protein